MTRLASEPRHPVEALYFWAPGPERLDSSGRFLINRACPCVSVPAQGWALSNRSISPSCPICCVKERYARYRIGQHGNNPDRYFAAASDSRNGLDSFLRLYKDLPRRLQTASVFFGLRHYLCSACHRVLFWAGCFKLRFGSPSARLAEA